MKALFRTLAVSVAVFLCAAAPAWAVCGVASSTCYWVGGTGTWDGVTTTHWASSSGGTGSVAVPLSTDAVVFDGSSGGGTVTVDTNVTVTSLTAGAFTGTLDFSANNNTVTAKSVNLDGTGTRTINGGTGQWTMVGNWNGLGSSSLFEAFTVTNATLNFSSTPIYIQPSGAYSTAGFGAISWSPGNGGLGNVTLDGSNFNGNPIIFVISAANSYTIASLTIIGPAGLSMTGASTITLTNGLSVSGNSQTSPTFLGNITNPNALLTLAVASNTVALNWMLLANVKFTYSGTEPVANNSVQIGAPISGIVVNPPSNGGSHIIGG